MRKYEEWHDGLEISKAKWQSGKRYKWKKRDFPSKYVSIYVFADGDGSDIGLRKFNSCFDLFAITRVNWYMIAASELGTSHCELSRYMFKSVFAAKQV